jgi:Tol biopolymer transport system component
VRLRRAGALIAIALVAGGATGTSGSRPPRAIVFLSNWTPHFRTSEIYLVDARRGPPRDLTNNELEDVDPSWAPDGKQIVFASRRHGGFDLYRMHADGSGVRRLLSQAGDQRQPVWSPDGEQIAFISPGRDANEKGWHPNQLFVMNSDGSGIRQVTHQETGVSDPAWSPDGTKLAGADGVIFTVNADGSNLREFSPAVETEADAHPSWSPDGSRLAFDREQLETTTTDLWLMNADGKGQRRLARFGGQPAWSPDGRRIAFVNGDVWSCDKDGCFEEGLSAVATISATGGRRHFVTRPLERLGQSFGSPDKWLLSDDATYFGLRWSPGGRRLLYARRLEQRAPDLFALSRRSATPRRLSATREVEERPVVSPDGSRVMFERYPLGGGAPGVFVMQVDARGLRRLAVHGYSGAWSPDGRRVAFLGKVELGGSRLPTIYVANRDGSKRRRLAKGSGPTWSPDGRRLAFLHATRPGLFGGDTISVVNADGTGARQLLFLPRRSLYGLAWSPAGDWLAFVSASRRATLSNFIELVNVKTGETRVVTGTRFWEGAPVWSPSGGSLAFERRNPYSTLVAVVVSRADGRGAHRVGKWSWRETGPTWSPDGSRIAIATMRHGNYEITTVHPDGGDPRTLTNNLADNIEPSW